MEIQEDREYQAKAIKLLDQELKNCAWDSKIDKKRIMALYAEASLIVQNSSSHKKLMALAQTLIDSLARIVRCVAIEEEAAKRTLIKGREVELEAEVLFYNTDNEVKEMRKFAGKMKRHNAKPRADNRFKR
ncbi:hypothetical protein QWZ13_08170 [Reinekea marina]|uniref:Uncharacterized protein n=1 Tax=Reinekea marina TaxID=1310421 RepID=A0ABV7WU17_9GAMM|nr:hypothetical protein [Reinekea marina]MDN3648885.1 hypothetical protein [Reinekea marina]